MASTTIKQRTMHEIIMGGQVLHSEAVEEQVFDLSPVMIETLVRLDNGDAQHWHDGRSLAALRTRGLVMLHPGSRHYDDPPAVTFTDAGWGLAQQLRTNAAKALAR